MEPSNNSLPKTRFQITSLENFSPSTPPSSGRRLLPLHRHLGWLRLRYKISPICQDIQRVCPIFFFTGKCNLLVRRQPTKINCLQRPRVSTTSAAATFPAHQSPARSSQFAAGAATVASSSRFGGSRKLRHEPRQLVQQCTALDPDAC